MTGQASIADTDFHYTDEQWAEIASTFPISISGTWGFQDDEGNIQEVGVRWRIECAIDKILFIHRAFDLWFSKRERALAIATASRSLLAALQGEADPLGRVVDLGILSVEDRRALQESLAKLSLIDMHNFDPPKKRRPGPDNGRRNELIEAVAQVWHEQFGSAPASETLRKSRRTFVGKALRPVLGDATPSTEALRKVLP